VQRSYQVLDRMEQAFENGNLNARPGTMVYNTMLNGESLPLSLIYYSFRQSNKMLSSAVEMYR
jgi:hypothetical protein